MKENEIKSQVRDYWDTQTCGTWASDKPKFTKDYFEEIEEERYELQPEIFSLAQFTRGCGKKVLEVGVGAGTDFLQWARSGAEVYGVDLTEEAVAHVRHRLAIYGFAPKEILVADCECLPFEDNFFDICYSWGVIHHTPDTEKALDEIVRVLKPGGEAKIMIYHRRSLLALFFWFKHCLLKLRPWRSFKWVLWNKMESIGTKAFTRKEVRRMLAKHSLDKIYIAPVLSYYDKLGRFNKLMQLVAKIFAYLAGGNRVGWFLTIKFTKMS